MSSSGWRQSLLLCLAALLGLLGATWLDLLTQHAAGGSAWDIVSPRPADVLVRTDDQGIHVVYPGTGLDAGSIQADLAIGLNNALPLALLDMTPLYPTGYASGMVPRPPPHDPTVLSIALWWLCVLVLCAVLAVRAARQRSTPARVLTYLLATSAVVLFAGYLLALFANQLLGAMSGPLVVAYVTTAAVMLGAPLLGLGRYAALESALGPKRVAASAVAMLWTAALTLLALLGFAWSALWLGWYTYDTRVNFLEPVSGLLCVYVAALAVLALLTSLLRGREGRPSRLGLVAIALVAALATQAPLPPRQSRQVDYVLLNTDRVVRYDNSPGTEPAVPEQTAAMFGAELTRLLTGPDPRSPSIGFNSANLYPHVPVALSWLRPLLMLAALGLLCAFLVLGVRTVAVGAATLWRAAVLRQPGPLALAVLVTVTASLPFAHLGSELGASMRSHGMARMLVLLPARVVNMGYYAYASYFSSPDQVPVFATVYRDWVAGLESDATSAMLRLVRARVRYLTTGASGWMRSDSIEELIRKRELLALAVAQGEALRRRLERFPQALERALLKSEVEAPLAAASRQTWERWVRPALAYLRVQNAELATHRAYMDAIVERGLEGVTVLFGGAVVIGNAIDDRLTLAALHLAAAQSSLKLERARGGDPFAPISERANLLASARRAAVLLRRFGAAEKLAACFQDPSSYTLMPETPEPTVRWTDEETHRRCTAAAADVNRARRGEL